MSVYAILSLILGLLFLAGGIALLVVYGKRYIKRISETKITKKEVLFAALFSFLVGLGVLSLILSLFLANPSWKTQGSWIAGPYKGKEIDYGSLLGIALFGGFLWGFSNAFMWTAFAVRFYKANLEKRAFDIVRLALYGGVALVFFSFLLTGEGLAPYLSYPLFNSIAIDGSGVHLSKPYGFSGYISGGLHIAFYAICILTGVAISYFVSDHGLYKVYKKHGILDTLVLVAFPAGVIGARIWYVVGNWDREFAGQGWTKPFEIWNGGLTILGGAAAGVLVGVLFLRATKKFVDMRIAIDVVVPTILLAQAMGRFGNFFNLEVYGMEVEATGIWTLLPSWILTDMSFKNGGGALTTGMINVPLFLVEAILNVVGYYLIAYGVGKGLKKCHSKGTLCGFYFLWYGIVRIVMEPMRNANFNMGTDNAWSMCNSIAYIILGLLIIASFHLYDFYEKKAKSLSFPIIGGVLSFIALFMPFLQSLSVSEKKDGTGSLVQYTGFDVIFGKSPYYLTAYIFLGLTLLSFLIWILIHFFKKDYERYARLLPSALALLTALLFFLGSGAVDVGDVGSAYVNISYGFVLVALLSLASALIGILPAYRDFLLGRRKKVVPIETPKEGDAQ